MKTCDLLFDLGGVIMDIRRENAVEALAALGMRDAGSFLGDYEQKGPFLALERGDIGAPEFRREMRRYFDREVTDAELDAAFMRFLTGIPVERLRRLEQLRRSHRVFMLSNTNPIMWQGRIADEFRKDGHDRDYYFDGCVASFDVNAYKPDPEIFRIACERYGLDPATTVFFDDSQANCDAAAALGFSTRHIAGDNDFMTATSEFVDA